MREIKGRIKYIIIAYAVIASLFHIYTGIFGTIHSMLQRSIHLMFLLPLAFLLYPAHKDAPKDKIPLYDIVLAILAAIPGLYIVLNFNWVINRTWGVTPLLPIEKILGILFIMLVIEATRRTVGVTLAVLATIFLIYPLVASSLPGALRGGSATLEEVLETMYLTTEGILSIPVGVSATYVILFLIFAAFLEVSGIGDYFMKLVILIAGKRKGGPAKVAVISSGIMGMLSGSAVANVYGTGSFTIPIMKKVGFPKDFAGAVEAVASSGGQIMPPIMGAGAFIMASLLGIPYLKVVKAAILPALLYYLGVYVVVHFRSVKENLGVIPDETIPSKNEVLRKIYLITPVLVLIYTLIFRTPQYAAVVGIFAAIAVAFISKDTRLSLNDFIKALSEGAIKAIPVAAACASAGVVVGAINLTGIGFKIVGGIIDLSGGIGLIAAIFVAVIGVIMGMGLPTTAAYVVVAAIAVPALTRLEFLPLASHFFVFYYAILSNITYPVALAVYAAASISGGDPKKIGGHAVKLGIMGFIAPFLALYNPSLLFEGPLTMTALSFLFAVVGTILLGAGIVGYLRKELTKVERIIIGCIGTLGIIFAASIGFFI
ncbi:MAG TPA: C4-dicarboxylate ABC transporter permease [Petrotoga sp.]|nr:C4-dicarboxylate ABC transporter permease [Petrotoga sp.]